MTSIASLNPDQQAALLAEFKEGVNPSVNDLILVAFPRAETTDARSRYGKAIKQFLATQGLSARGKSVYVAQGPLEITDDQKQFIKNNAPTMSALEMAQLIFKNPALTNLHQEVRTVVSFINEEGLNEIEGTSEIPSSDYKPPKSVEGTFKKVDKYVSNHNFRRGEYSGHQKACLEALTGYLTSLRLTSQINVYEELTSRDLFESTFIRYTYDKPDLTQEEVDQYLVLANETVESHNIQRRKAGLQRLLDLATSQVEDNDVTSRVRLTQPLVLTIQDSNKEYNECVGRQQKLLSDLKQKRSVRMKELRNQNSSVLNFFQSWKEEKDRVIMIEQGERKKEILKGEVDRMKSFDGLKARIFGLSEEEVLHG